MQLKIFPVGKISTESEFLWKRRLREYKIGNSTRQKQQDVRTFKKKLTSKVCTNEYENLI